METVKELSGKLKVWLLAARVSRKVLGGKKGSETSQYASVVDPGLWRSSQHLFLLRESSARCCVTTQK